MSHFVHETEKVLAGFPAKNDMRWSNALWLFPLGGGEVGCVGRRRKRLEGEVPKLCGEGWPGRALRGVRRRAGLWGHVVVSGAPHAGVGD